MRSLSPWVQGALAGLWFGLAAPGGLLAAEEPARQAPFQFEVRTGAWISEGNTRFSHNASVADPRFGNPTSRLEYQDTGTNVAEIGGTVTFRQRLFLRTDYGFGDIGGGRLTDDDFVSAAGAATFGTADRGGHRFSRTFSDLKGNDLWYVNADIGYKFLHFPERKGSLGAFLGYQHWTETYEAFGVTQAECTAPGVLCNAAGSVVSSSRKVITNEATWDSLRLGVEGDFAVLNRLSLGGKVAFIPYTALSNTDIHHLRAGGAGALNQDASFTMQGTGLGVNAEASASLRLIHQLYFDVGYRFWWLDVYDGTLTSHPLRGASESFPLTEFRSIRQGATLGLRYSF
jgi:hypothetical protein